MKSETTVGLLAIFGIVGLVLSVTGIDGVKWQKVTSNVPLAPRLVSSVSSEPVSHREVAYEVHQTDGEHQVLRPVRETSALQYFVEQFSLSVRRGEDVPDASYLGR